MPGEVHGSLQTGAWLSGIQELAQTCAAEDGAAEDRAVRRAFHFLKLSPPGIARMWQSGLSEARMENMLERQNARDAACEIIGDHAAISLSVAGGARRHVAELRYDDEGSVSAEAATPALALIAAWAQMLSVPR